MVINLGGANYTHALIDSPMAAAVSGSVVEPEGSEDAVDRKLERDKEETPQEGTEKHMELVEVRWLRLGVDDIPAFPLSSVI